MKILLTTAMLIAMGSWVSGCNTTRGVGQDVEATGEAVQDAAENASDALKKN